MKCHCYLPMQHDHHSCGAYASICLTACTRDVVRELWQYANTTAKDSEGSLSNHGRRSYSVMALACHSAPLHTPCIRLVVVVAVVVVIVVWQSENTAHQMMLISAEKYIMQLLANAWITCSFASLPNQVFCFDFRRRCRRFFVCKKMARRIAYAIWKYKRLPLHPKILDKCCETHRTPQIRMKRNGNKILLIGTVVVATAAAAESMCCRLNCMSGRSDRPDRCVCQSEK